MKKVLIATSALVAAGFIAAGPAAAAEKIKLGLGGFQNTWVGFADQDDTFEGTRDYGSFDVKTNSEIHFKGSTKLDNGLTVGAHVELESDRDSGGAIDHSYAYISSAQLGTLYAGGTSMAHSRLATQAPSAANNGQTSGGQEGPRQWIVNPGISVPNFVHIDATDTNQVQYISPSFSGLQVGASYNPNYANADQNAPNYDSASGDSEAYDFAAKYATSVDGVGITLSASYFVVDGGGMETAGLSGEIANGGFKQIRTGISLSYAGFTLGGAYMDTNDDGDANQEGDAYNVGLMYATGPYKISANYWHSEAEGARDIGTVATTGEDKYTFVGLNGSYNMGPGVDLKGTIARVEYEDETTTATANNEGWFAAAGMNLAF